MNRTINVYPNRLALAQAAAEKIVRSVKSAVSARGRASLVLTGGSTPRETYQQIAEHYQESVAWSNVDVFFGDERFVPHDDSNSNYRMARESLLDHFEFGNVFPMPTDVNSPQLGAEKYADIIRDYFGDESPVFDVMLLGLGDDGHIASLFPGSDTLDVEDDLVISATAPDSSPVRDRITMTLPMLNGSRHLFFIVAGANKKEAVRNTIHQGSTPAARVDPSGTMVWLIDEEAYPGEA